MSDNILVKLFEPIQGINRTICLPSNGISISELESLLSATFNGCQFVGVHDSKDDIEYPLAILAQNPKILQSTRRPLSLILNQESKENLLDSGDCATYDSEHTLYTDEMAEITFYQLDLNGDNHIHIEEMIEYLTMAFEYLCVASKQFAHSMKNSPKELAIYAARHCFYMTQTSEDEYLTIDTFIAWYLGPSEDQTRALVIGAIEAFYQATGGVVDQPLRNPRSPTELSGNNQPIFTIDDKESLLRLPSSTTAANLYNEEFIEIESNEPDYDEIHSPSKGDVSFEDYDGEQITLEKARQIIGLDAFPSSFVVAFFEELVDEGSILKHAKFHYGLSKLISRNYMTLSTTDRAAADHIITSIYPLCELDETGCADARDVLTMLLLFCGGDLDGKAHSAFYLFSDDDNGVSAERMASCLTSIFKIVSVLDPSFSDSSSPDSIAATFTLNIFAQAGLTLYNEQKLSQDTFEKWFILIIAQFEDNSNASSPVEYSHEPVQENKEDNNNEIIIDEDEDAIDLDEESPPSAVVLELRRARTILGLNGYSADDLMETLGESAPNGKLSATAFLATLNNITRLSMYDEEKRAEALRLGMKIFKYFDSGSTGYVSYIDFAVGLTSLCDSPIEDKIMVNFVLLDGNGDGLLTFAEFERMIIANMKVVLASSSLAASKVHTLVPSITDAPILLARAAILESLRTINPVDQTLSMQDVLAMCDDCCQIAA